MKPTLGNQIPTARGFPCVEFKDFYNHKCSIQASSITNDERINKPGTTAIWLGVDDADPKVRWDNANALGVRTGATEGWVPYPLSDDVLLTTRMHLDRDQVKALIGHLQQWLKTGEF